MSTPMPLMRRVLVPLDGSELAETAARYAGILARPETQVLLFQVVPHPQPMRSLFSRAEVSEDELITRYQDAARASLSDAARRLLPSTDVAIEVGVGDAAEEILRVATDRDAGLIVMGTQGLGAIGRLAFGSVADRVARTSPVPVMIVGPATEDQADAPVAIQRLIVPLDGSERSAKALPVAAELAKSHNLPVLLLTVIGTTEVPHPVVSMAYGPAYSTTTYDELFTEAQVEGQRMLDAAKTSLEQQDIAVTAEVLAGSAAGLVMETTRPGDVIVMASHGQSGVRRWLLGSVAEKLIRSSPVPVLLVRVMGDG